MRPGPFVFIAVLMTASTIGAQDYDLSWHTIDGGGATFSAGGDFELGGTIGQHDAGPSAGPMTGNGYELRGGFWTVAPECTCPGDTNGDGARNGADIQHFVGCLVNDSGCACADVDAIDGVTIDDVVVFVGDLLAGDDCP